ncbi:MAG: rhodanese-like domain-containing protein [Alicyclobacillus sp.]|nr:rhodanese-like domain-containing protein [Alicyclobacillus sp.]
MAFEQDGIAQYDKEELKEILASGARTVIDVRTPEEYENGHIPGVPLKPLQELEQWAPELDPAGSYIFVCRSGARSQKASQILKEHGFEDVANFHGGMLSWDGAVATGSDRG